MENNQVIDNNTQLNNDVEAAQIEPTEKTYTQEQVNEMIARRVARETKKIEAEKERKQFEQEKKLFAEQMKAFEQQKIKNQTMQMLGERNMPVELAQFITSQNADEIMDNVNTFQKHFNEAVEKVVAERLRGKTPSVSTMSKGFNMNDLKNMSPAEINANWNKIKNNLK